jgi:formate/nitrite transporter FocA (FNT family)
MGETETGVGTREERARREQETATLREQQRRERARRDGDESGGAPSDLSPQDQQKALEASQLDAKTTYEVIREEGEKELDRSSGALAFSGLAAGLTMGLSMVAEGVLRSHLPDAEWRPLITKLGYPVGFLAVILGSQQLFTENTLTPVVPLLSKKSHVRLPHVLRLWGIVLLANLIGTILFALVAAYTELFRPETRDAFAAIGREALEGSFGAIFIRAVAAGWVIAMLVWMLPDAKYGRVPVIIIMTYLIGVAGLSHIIAGSAEVFFTVAIGEVSWQTYLGHFILPTLLGNVVGGTMLVASLNHAQVTAGE